MNIYHLLDFRKKKKMEKKLKIGNRKTNFIFWNFKDPKKWKIGEGGGTGGRIFRNFFYKKHVLAFKEIEKIGIFF